MTTTILTLQQLARDGEKIALLTCYDASFAKVLDAAGVDALLIGDSLGMVLQGHASTLPVTLEQVAYHTRCVAAGAQRALIIADMPFGSYQESPAQAYRSAAQLMAAGAQMVKVEGGAWLAPTIEFLVARSIPVCGHLGLTPQSVHALGGYRVQGKTPEAAEMLRADATAIANAGASIAVLELMPAVLAAAVTATVPTMPTIGIGAGPDCSGQVLVLHDMLGLTAGKVPRFVRNFLDGQPSIEAAVRAYVQAVKDKSFPAPEHCY
jgi:3-methyl-2-oxobutanoate hydroxymethyltransferase